MRSELYPQEIRKDRRASIFGILSFLGLVGIAGGALVWSSLQEDSVPSRTCTSYEVASQMKRGQTVEVMPHAVIGGGDVNENVQLRLTDEGDSVTVLVTLDARHPDMLSEMVETVLLDPKSPRSVAFPLPAQVQIPGEPEKRVETYVYTHVVDGVQGESRVDLCFVQADD